MRSACAACLSTPIAALVEVNPLVVTKDGELLALDAKMNVRRQRHVSAQTGYRRAARHLAKKSRPKIRAGEAGLSYVKLDGNIGCLVNGAGLAMSTMDLIQTARRFEPANFLDVGGGANVEQVTEAFRILLADKNVKGRVGEHLRRHHAVYDDRLSIGRSLQDARFQCPTCYPP